MKCVVHDLDYRQSKKDFDAFVESLTPAIIEKDETIPELPPKDLVRFLPAILLALLFRYTLPLSYANTLSQLYDIDISHLPRHPLLLRSYPVQTPFQRCVVSHWPQRAVCRLLPADRPLALLSRGRALASRSCPSGTSTPRH